MGAVSESVDIALKSFGDDLKNLSQEDLVEITWRLLKPYYRRRPVKIDEFIDNPQFLGNSFKGSNKFYPFWRQCLNDIYPTELHSPYYELIFELPIGSGKTLTATVITLYEIYKLQCMEEPRKFYGLQRGVKIVFSIFSATLGLSTNVNWEYFDSFLTDSPYFIKNCPLPEGGKQVSYDSVVFPDNISIDLGSKDTHAIGKAVFGGMLDEANFQRVASNQAKTNYNNLKRRRESRFLGFGGSVPGKLILMSSPRFSTDFLEEQKESSRGLKSVYIIENVPIWEINKGTTKDVYSGETFKVFVGSKTADPRIITEEEKISDEIASFVYNVPVEYYDSFSSDLISSLRDIFGLSISRATAFIPSVQKVNSACVMKSRSNKEIISLDFFDKEENLSSYIDTEYFSRLPFPESYRFIHIDLAKNNCRAALASTFVRTDLDIIGDSEVGGTFSSSKEIVNRSRMYFTEFLVYLQATPGQEIPFYKIRDLVFFLKKIGYPILRISADQYQSVDMLQQFKVAGLKTENISLDRTRTPYLSLKQLIYSGKVLMPNHPLLKKELLGLVDDSEHIDHSNNSSKDGSDAVAGSVWSALTSEVIFKPSSVFDSYASLDRNKKKDPVEKIFDESKNKGFEDIFKKMFGSKLY